VLTGSAVAVRRGLIFLSAAAVGCSSAERPVQAPAPEVVSLPLIEQAGRIAAPLTPALTAADLDQRLAELFGGAHKVDVSIPVPNDSVGLELEVAPTWDIDVRSYETFDRVRFYVSAFTGSAKGRFAERLSRGSRYESMIRTKLREGGLPEDMYYLALVESGYNPHAYSRAAAVGMWQFMTTTARGMGLRVDWWVDERRDPVRATDGAVRFLRGLNEQFGSLYLAAAAYNGGPGRIARGLSRFANELEGSTGDDMFFALVEKKYLRNETREYVPQLIAAALVAKEADRYGLTLQTLEPFRYDSARVGPMVPLHRIAQASGTTVAVIQELNPHILRGMTPPGVRDSIFVRIPAGALQQFTEGFATLPADSVAGARYITAEKGATWASIARKTKASSRALPVYNPKVKPAKKTGVIPQGTPILVPTAAVVAAALPVPDPAVERYGAGTRSHIVRSGENLTVIARRYQTTPAAIMQLNRLKKPLIFPGQELRVRR
jgi:membrane-bound lytic murein transglycosylase D